MDLSDEGEKVRLQILPQCLSLRRKDILNAILSKSEIRQKIEDTIPPIIFACLCEDVEYLKELLSSGSDQNENNIVGFQFGPCSVAICLESVEILEILLSCPSIDLKSGIERIGPLNRFRVNVPKASQMLQIILDSKRFQTTSDFRNIFESAISEDHVGIVRMLLEADFNEECNFQDEIVGASVKSLEM
eukprot:CAMPEP_0117066918 /NCGR_PEP_ID=MMETSP0472-20121206/46823_1 /TAXON_ID=693140 ORGANISM="Tiarina fusus, Strain LIS" /NCGR_SAMPLE_ID=MMETSP0472 /ASSEMBLY_ACC=CAM_ASM_000603 /LENGTH=188 /DNA_ID=CAMNT_0004788217 /DNA_START=49 /DNA_END=612 /DNA_ORIENTATION=-